jgi:hypothetical protein
MTLYNLLAQIDPISYQETNTNYEFKVHLTHFNSYQLFQDMS